MIAIFRAPELSATSRIERIWIMIVLLRSDFLCLLDDARHDPALPPAHRTTLDDGHAVAHLGRVGFVVRQELRGPALGLAVERIAHLALDRHDHALLHLVADHDACD